VRTRARKTEREIEPSKSARLPGKTSREIDRERENKEGGGWRRLPLLHVCVCARALSLDFSLLQCFVLQCDAVCCSHGMPLAMTLRVARGAVQSAVCCSVLQCVAVCCSVLQCVAVCCSVLQCDIMCCSMLQPSNTAMGWLRLVGSLKL